MRATSRRSRSELCSSRRSRLSLSRVDVPSRSPLAWAMAHDLPSTAPALGRALAGTPTRICPLPPPHTIGDVKRRPPSAPPPSLHTRQHTALCMPHGAWALPERSGAARGSTRTPPPLRTPLAPQSAAISRNQPQSAPSASAATGAERLPQPSAALHGMHSTRPTARRPRATERASTTATQRRRRLPTTATDGDCPRRRLPL